MSVSATFLDIGNQIEYSQLYQTRRGFLSAVSRGSKKSLFLHAVDYELMQVIKPDNLESYRKGNIKSRESRLSLFKK